MSSDGTVAGRVPALLRLAHQMVGDPGVAADLVARVVSRRRMRRALAGANDQVVVTALVRSALRAPSTTNVDTSPLASLPPRERIAVVLAFAAGWDATGIAEAMRTSARRVHAHVRRALDIASERQWRALLADNSWDVTSGVDLDRRTAVAARARHAHRVTTCTASGAVLTLVAGVIVATVRVVTAPAPLPPTAHGHGLLPWQPRGALVRDTAFIATATSLWRGSVDRPRGQVYVLYAGRVGSGRLAVLQALGRDGKPSVAVVADHDVTFNRPRLRLDMVAPLPRDDVPVLTVPYDGNLAIPGLTSGPGSRVLQALVAPGIDEIDERSSRDPAERSPRPGFTRQELSHGLSEPWLDLSGSLPDTAVRASRSGRVVFTGLVARSGVQPREVDGPLSAPPSSWSGLPRNLDAETLTDDILWWEQVCHSPQTTVALAWAGRVRAVVTPVRLELVNCPGGRLSARWLDGEPKGAQWIGESRELGDALAAVVPPDSLGPSTLVVVGSAAVASIDIAGVTTPGRVARALIKGTEPAIVVRDPDGRRLSVRLARSLPGELILLQ